MAEAFICRIFNVPYDFCDNDLFYNANHQRLAPYKWCSSTWSSKSKLSDIHLETSWCACSCNAIAYLIWLEELWQKAQAYSHQSSTCSKGMQVNSFFVDVQRAAPPKTVHAKRQEIYHVLLLASVLIDRCPTQTKSNPPKLMFVLQWPMTHMAPRSHPGNRKQQVPWRKSIIIFEYMPLHVIPRSWD